MSSSTPTSPVQNRSKLSQNRLSGTSTNQIPNLEFDEDDYDVRSPRYKSSIRPRTGSGARFTPFTAKGFLVTINKALTYEVDLSLTEEQIALLSDAYTSSYRYHDYPTDHLRNPDLTPFCELSATLGTCYRCRLKGVNFTDNDLPIWKVNKITIFAKQLTDRGNGWVTCTVHRIDQYHRLIVDINVVTTEGELSVKDQLLQYTNTSKDYSGLLVGV